jgi:hypothetical protein
MYKINTNLFQKISFKIIVNGTSLISKILELQCQWVHLSFGVFTIKILQTDIANLYSKIKKIGHKNI